MYEDGYDIISIFIIAHGGTNYVRLGGVPVTAADFVAAMNDHPNVQFNFLCGSCHSGSFMDELLDCGSSGTNREFLAMDHHQ